MDQPTYTPTQKIVEATGTLFFKFGDLDATKPAGGIKIRIETIVHYLSKYSQGIMQRKLEWLSPNCPLGPLAPSAPLEAVQQKASVAQQLSSSAS
jgi:predicted nucleotide-binding protein (sugar kinase/HSP70/actin superfamily)